MIKGEPMNTSSEANPDPSPRAPHRRGCLFLVRRGLLILVIGLVGLILLGVAYQAVATELDKSGYSPRGQLYPVNGHLMHLVCMGEGSPTVVLQAGGVAESLWWYRVQNQVAAHTRVCAFDRPGLGWSEPVSGPRDPLTIDAELHTLLEQASVPGPYVMAGHSWGAVLTRIYAAQYPDEVAGIVLVDSSILIPKHFASQDEFDQWKTQWDGAQLVASVTTRIGLTRLIQPSLFQQWGYPPDIVPEMAALQSRNQVFDTDIAEFVTAMEALTEASAAAEDLGDFPMAVLWATEDWIAYDAYIESAPALRAEISTYSSNNVTRSVEGSNHGSILGNEAYAQQVSDAILDVIATAETGAPLAR